MQQITARAQDAVHGTWTPMSQRLVSRAGVLATISLLLLSGLAGPAEAAKKAEPTSTGVVLRPPEAIGGHDIGPMPVDVGDATLPLLVVFGWDSAVTFCEDGDPVDNGVQQITFAQGGHVTVVVHNADIPVLVFNVAEYTNEGGQFDEDHPEDDFYAACADGDVGPLAQGTAKQRPIITEDADGFTIRVKSRGVVTDAAEQPWQLQAFFRLAVDFTSPEGPTVDSWVTLREL